MTRFKLSLRYEEGVEEVVEVEAATVSSAKKMCEEIVGENSQIVERLERFNVWTSRRLKSCSLCPYDYRLDFLGCDAVLNLKNDV